MQFLINKQKPKKMSSAKILTRFSKNFNDNVASSHLYFTNSPPHGAQKKRFDLLAYAECVAMDFVESSYQSQKPKQEPISYYWNLANAAFYALTLQNELQYTIGVKDGTMDDLTPIYAFREKLHPRYLLDIPFCRGPVPLFFEILQKGTPEQIPYAYAMATALSNQSKFFSLDYNFHIEYVINVAKKNDWLFYTVPQKEKPLFFFYKDGRVKALAEFGYETQETILLCIFYDLYNFYKNPDDVFSEYFICRNEIELINAIVNKFFPHLTMGQL